MALDQNQMMKMYGGSMLGGGLMDLFGNKKNPADKANEYLNRIPGEAGKYYEPWRQLGERTIPGMEDEYNKLLGNPGDKLNQIGQNYKQSPGFNFALQQALGASNRGAAAGGMAGSPASQQQNMQIGSDLASQDYNNWMQNALGLYNQGLGGKQDFMHMGQNSSNNMADMIQQMLAQQAAYGYQGQASKNQSNPWGNILGGLAGMFF